MQYRIPARKSKYYLPKETFLTAVHYARQYPIWVAELDALLDGNRAIRYDKDKVQSNNASDPVFDAVARREKLNAKKALVDSVARDVAGENLFRFLIMGVCYGMYYYQLKQFDIPCGKNYYYQLRQKFFCELSERI